MESVPPSVPPPFAFAEELGVLIASEFVGLGDLISLPSSSRYEEELGVMDVAGDGLVSKFCSLSLLDDGVGSWSLLLLLLLLLDAVIDGAIEG